LFGKVSSETPALKTRRLVLKRGVKFWKREKVRRTTSPQMTKKTI
jgi:hypothetical protein